MERREGGKRNVRKEELHDGNSLALLTAFFLGTLRVRVYTYVHSSNSAVAALLGALRSGCVARRRVNSEQVIHYLA